MHTVDQLVDDVLRREGGFVNDPDDLGGATKYGVTIHTMRRFGLDVDGNGVVDIRDVKTLPRSAARELYKREYFEGPRIDDLPEALQPTVFDMYVNAGRNAIKILQRLLNKMGARLKVDGVLGPNTIGTAHEYDDKSNGALPDAYSVERRNYYFRIADRRPQNRKYARTRAGGKGGWIKRAEEFMSPKYRMTDAEFQARVRKWD